MEEIEIYRFRDLSGVRTALLTAGIVGGAMLLVSLTMEEQTLDLGLGCILCLHPTP